MNPLMWFMISVWANYAYRVQHHHPIYLVFGFEISASISHCGGIATGIEARNQGIKQSCLNASMMPYSCRLTQQLSGTATTPSLTLVRLLLLLLNIPTLPPTKMTLKWMRCCIYYHYNCSSSHHSNSQLYYSKQFPVAPKHPYPRPSSTIQFLQLPKINPWSLLLEQQ